MKFSCFVFVTITASLYALGFYVIFRSAGFSVQGVAVFFENSVMAQHFIFTSLGSLAPAFLFTWLIKGTCVGPKNGGKE